MPQLAARGASPGAAWRKRSKARAQGGPRGAGGETLPRLGRNRERKVTPGSAGSRQDGLPQVRSAQPRARRCTSAPVGRGAGAAVGRGAVWTPVLPRAGPSWQPLGAPEPAGKGRRADVPGEGWRRAPGLPCAGRALGPERRTCWRAPSPARPPPGEPGGGARAGAALAEGPARRWRWRRGPGAPWPSCCGACRTPSSSPASSAAAGSSRRPRKAPERTARAPRRARRRRPGSLAARPPTARAAGDPPTGCSESGSRR